MVEVFGQRKRPKGKRVYGPQLELGEGWNACLGKIEDIGRAVKAADRGTEEDRNGRRCC